ncbi:MAG: hypothetical protein KAR40_11320 [Candidatus Sabulitectum sp.]|nr:hypothetical protein [Candidatus Sabulitectum sp.]
MSEQLSNCCGTPPGECSDIGICPSCHEHCEWIIECDECEGKGFKNNTQCSKCDGSGEMEEES